MAGTLYIVATPIGNLEDITFRAVRVLKEAGLIACEDTRHTRKLLDHYGIATPLVSYHEHNETARSGELIGKLLDGQSIALVSDAGTPLLADPGYRIVHEARRLGLSIVPVPGPSALLAALSASGLPTDAFVFRGFLPPKQGQRRKVLEDWKDAAATLVFYEAPHRILDTLSDVAAVLGERPVVLAREITKLHEEFLPGTASGLREQLAARDAIRGEFTILVGKSETQPNGQAVSIQQEIGELLQLGIPRMEALKQVARRRGFQNAKFTNKSRHPPKTHNYPAGITLARSNEYRFRQPL